MPAQNLSFATFATSSLGRYGRSSNMQQRAQRPLALLLLVQAADAGLLRVPTFVSSSMALQRAPQSAQLWGTTAPGAHVVLTLDASINASGIADAEGRWKIALPPQPAGIDHTIVVASADETIVLEDIAFGDVYLCSGQSNSECAQLEPEERARALPPLLVGLTLR